MEEMMRVLLMVNEIDGMLMSMGIDLICGIIDEYRRSVWTRTFTL